MTLPPIVGVIQQVQRRMWFAAAVAAALASLSAKIKAEQSATKGVLVTARAAAAVADGDLPAIPDDVKRESAAWAKHADVLRPISFWLLVAGAVFLVASIFVHEPVRQDWAVPLLVMAFLMQFVMV